MSARWRRLGLVALLGSVLAACAVQPPARPPVDPALVKGNILRLADAEWNAFGGQTISYEDGHERIYPVGVWEDERRGSPRVGQYWRTVGEEWSGYVPGVHLVTPDNIAFDGGPKNIFDPDNGYRDEYKKIWGVN